MPSLGLTVMQRLDKWLGVPLALLLGLVSHRPRCLMGDAPITVPARVLVAKFLGVGSVALSLPLLAALKRTGARVVLWTFPGPAALVREAGVVDELWVVEPSLSQFLPTLIATLGRARAMAPQLFIDLEPTAYFSAVLGWLSKAPERLGFLGRKPLREGLFTRLLALNAGRHMLDHYAAIAGMLGLDPKSLAFPAPADGALSGSLQVLLPKRADRRLVVVNLNTSELGREQRQWPVGHWAALALGLARDPQVRVLFTGVADEGAQVQAVWREVMRTSAAGLPVAGDETQLIDLCGNTTLADLLVLLRRAALVVSVDSAMVHLAALGDTPVVALFGPETPALWEPRHARARTVYAGLPCSPCCTFATDKKSRCRDNQCMKRISPQEVLTAARELLALPPTLADR